MSSKLRPYSCVTCSKRMKTSERRPLSGNKVLRKFLSKRFVTDLNESDVVCNKCRQLLLFSETRIPIPGTKSKFWQRKCCPTGNTYDTSYSVYWISTWCLCSLWKETTQTCCHSWTVTTWDVCTTWCVHERRFKMLSYSYSWRTYDLRGVKSRRVG